MKVINNSKNRIAYHDSNKVLRFINVGEVAEVEEYLAKILLQIDGVEEYAEPKDLRKLEEENAKLKAQLENGDGTTPSELDKLKAEADELGIKYAKNIGAKTLQKKIDEYKANN